MASDYPQISDAPARLEIEFALLQEMYPHHVKFDSKSRDFKYISPNSSNATLVLRLPEYYPVEEEAPQVISASDRSKNDIRNQIQLASDAIGFNEKGSEILDILINHFEEATAEKMQASLATHQKGVESGMKTVLPSKTVIIWLHHLLNTSKRKLAITPSYNTAKFTEHGQPVLVEISGITKPGYPGIMIFSGGSDLVDAHVKELKDQNWQAFQIRYDSAEESNRSDQTAKEWEFACCKGKIVEVETMADIVQNIVEEKNKRIFLKAIGVK